MSRPLCSAALLLGASALLTLSPLAPAEETKPQSDQPAPKAAPEPAAPASDKAAPEDPKLPAPVIMNPDNALGDFGSGEPVARQDEPERGVIHFPITMASLTNGEHWDQYVLPFKSKRWGKYHVRITYTLNTSALGLQFLFDKGTPAEVRIKKQLNNTGGAKRKTTLGDIYIPDATSHYMALYTPQSVGFTSFVLQDVALVPAIEGAEPTQEPDGSLQLLAKDAITWSEHMRYEPKPEKNCLGFWTDVKDFAEWEFRVEKPGKFKVSVLQGSSTGKSEVAVQLGEQELKFTVQNTGDFHKIAEVPVGEVEIKQPGTYHLAVKPQTKNGSAIMDIKKVVLAPVS